MAHEAKNARTQSALVRLLRKSIATRSARRWKKLPTSTAPVPTRLVKEERNNTLGSN
jgi:hypothetical protein